MCVHCWTEAGSPEELPANADEIIEAIETLYGLPDCGTGGPLHVELDDWNLELETWTPYNGRPGDAPWYSPEAIDQAQKVCDLMKPLPVQQRFAVLAKSHGWI